MTLGEIFTSATTLIVICMVGFLVLFVAFQRDKKTRQ